MATFFSQCYFGDKSNDSIACKPLHPPINVDHEAGQATSILETLLGNNPPWLQLISYSITGDFINWQTYTIQ